MNINPRGPQPGQSAAEVVQGWLDAMQATPIRTTVAREFLSEDVAGRVEPDRDDHLRRRVRSRAARPDAGRRQLAGAAALDDRGAWQGAAQPGPSPSSRSRWSSRTASSASPSPPNALIVPELWFEQRFRQVSLYFFDPTAQVLVPDPVFVPRGEQLASALVRRAARRAGSGPGRRTRVNALPAGLRLGGLGPGVRRRAGRRASSPASPGAGHPRPRTPSCSSPSSPGRCARTRRSSGCGSASRGAGRAGRRRDRVQHRGRRRLRAVRRDASTLLYGLADGLMVAGAAQNLDPVSGPFGQARPGAAHDLARPAGRRGPPASPRTGRRCCWGRCARTARAVEPVVDGGTDLLEPAWDFSGRLWVVDRRADGAVVRYLPGPSGARPGRSPGSPART